MFKRLKQPAIAAIFATALVVGISIPAYAAVSTVTTNFSATPEGGTASPAFSVDVTLGSDKPLGSSIYRLNLYIKDPNLASGAAPAAYWTTSLCLNPFGVKVNPTPTQLAQCGIEKIERIPNGSTTPTLINVGLVGASSDGTSIDIFQNPPPSMNYTQDLLQTGDTVRISFLPGAFTTKTGSSFAVYGTFYMWCNSAAVSGLCTATNVNGYWTDSSATSTSFNVAALATPATPQAPGVVADATTATITPVVNTSGSHASSYLITASNGSTCTVVLPATSCTITGLTSGTAYSFTAQAINTAGTSAASPATTATTTGGSSGASLSTASSSTAHSPAGLAVTGFSNTPAAMSAALLVALGAALIAKSRQRPRGRHRA